MKTKKVEKAITTLKDGIGHPLKRHLTEILTRVNNLKAWMSTNTSQVDAVKNVKRNKRVCHLNFGLKGLTPKKKFNREFYSQKEQFLKVSIPVITLKISNMSLKSTWYVGLWSKHECY